MNQVVLSICGNSKLETRNSKLGIRNSKLRIRNPKLGIRNPKRGIRNSKLGIGNKKTWNLEFKARNPEFKAKSPKSTGRNPESDSALDSFTCRQTQVQQFYVYFIESLTSEMYLICLTCIFLVHLRNCCDGMKKTFGTKLFNTHQFKHIQTGKSSKVTGESDIKTVGELRTYFGHFAYIIR